MADAFYMFIYISRGSVNLLGIIGNLISFVVFCRPVFTKNSISVYCCALAIFDSFLAINQLYIDIYLSLDYFPPEHSDIVCKIYYYITTAFSGIPAWILVAFSIDKILSMRKSRRLELIKKRSFQFGIIAVFAISNILIFSEVLALIGLVPVDESNFTEFTCDLTEMPYVGIIGGLYLLEASIVPFLIMFGTSITIVRLITRSGRKSIGYGKNALAQRRKTRDFKFAVTSLTFNCLFITLRLPLVLFYILTSVEIYVTDSYLQIASLLFFINSSISFLVHFASNSIFRKELVILFKIRLPFKVTRMPSTSIIHVHPLNSSD